LLPGNNYYLRSNVLINTAFAMGSMPGGAAGQQGGGFAAFVPLILMFVVFYFLLIRPQQKKAKEHQEMVNSLKKGTKVITTGGIYGTIVKTDDDSVTLEIADNVKIKVVRANVAAIQ
jgi:preprotein translocase subunit YajC